MVENLMVMVEFREGIRKRRERRNSWGREAGGTFGRVIGEAGGDRFCSLLEMKPEPDTHRYQGV